VISNAQGSPTLGEQLTAWTPSPIDLIREVLRRSGSRFSELHGQEHWLGVAHAGLSVGRVTVGADLRVVFLFGLLHDAMRENEYDDPMHGERASMLVKELAVEGTLQMPEERKRLLMEACRLHSDGLTSLDPTIGTCWDADRLNLWRLGWPPAERLLSTAEGRSAERIAWAREAVRNIPSWPELLDSPWRRSLRSA
jgi:uncharacterized protein